MIAEPNNFHRKITFLPRRNKSIGRTFKCGVGYPRNLSVRKHISPRLIFPKNARRPTSQMICFKRICKLLIQVFVARPLCLSECLFQRSLTPRMAITIVRHRTISVAIIKESIKEMSHREVSTSMYFHQQIILYKNQKLILRKASKQVSVG